MLKLLLLLLVAGGVHAEVITRVTRILPTPAVELRGARSLSVAADGTLLIADTGHHRVLAIDSTGKLVFETGGFGRDHGQFQWPRKVVADRGTSVWVLDYGNRRIEKFSRSLEYQGTFLIPADGDGPPRQIEEFALSLQGDLFVFDRDAGRVLRYDPLFRVQGELGQNRGTEFVSSLARMAFVPDVGLVWWERGRNGVQVANALLSQVRTLAFAGQTAPGSLVLAAVDTCLVYGTTDLLRLWCDANAAPDSLASFAQHPDLKLKRLDDIAFAGRGTVYVLDGAAGTVYRVSLSER